MDQKLINKITSCSRSSKKISSLKNEIIDCFSSKINESRENVSILILNTPCNGFGDIIFAVKLKRYLTEWYPFATVKIATTKAKSFVSLGEKETSLIQLESLSQVGDCRRFQHLMPSIPLDHFDLIFVAPLQADFEPSLKDIRYLIPYADSYNTYFFSEYNDTLDKEFDFHTGIGKGRDGMFFVDIAITKEVASVFLNKNHLKKNKYAVCYIAETISKARECYLSFFEMISKKYEQPSFSVVCPEWIAKNLTESSIKRFYPYFSTVIVYKKDGQKIYTDKNKKNKNTLHIRGDVLPVPNNEMLILLKNSCDDMLLTGDQSITDALSCCPQKNIWYQIAPWKEGYAKELAKLLPNKYYTSRKTSCGTIKGISLTSDYREFVKKWDFRKIAKPRITKIINLALLRKYDPSVEGIIQEIVHSRTFNTLLKSLS